MSMISKFVEIKKTRDLFKILIGYFIIIFLALAPLIIAFGGGYIESKIVGHPVHEGNSGIFSIFWLALFTVPAGIVFLILFTIAIMKNVRIYFKSRKESEKQTDSK